MPKPSLCLNMIVKNEAARIERCLVSVLPYVKCAVILDTGSTDDTKAIIRDLCLRHAVAVEIRDGAFLNFSQARNLAFKVAKDARDVLPWFNFVLLMDADMELVVENPTELLGLDANAPGYDMMQKGGAVSYANKRIVNINAKDEIYVGVTHEYIDVPAAGLINGARFIDHADGSNRAEKYPRDAMLLEKALKLEPNNGRYWYYLGNTYRDWGKPAEAKKAYEQRISLGGWDEETHSTMMYLAGCEKDLNNDAGWVSGMLDAYSFRPQRAEPLYDLAKYYREKGNTQAALLFAEKGLDLPRPGDFLFVNDFVYEHGLRYEYSIAAFSDPDQRERAFEITNELALDPTFSADLRWSARTNLWWYTKPLGELCPSFHARKLEFPTPEGYTALNPSVTTHEGRIFCNIRCVNYKIDEQGCYTINGVLMHDTGAPIDTRNFVGEINITDFTMKQPAEVIWHRPPPLFAKVIGLEDIRLWSFQGDLHFSATVREQSAQGVAQIVEGQLRIDPKDTGFMTVHPDWCVVSDEVTYEKNWMPVPSTSDPRWMYRLDKVITAGVGTQKFECHLHVGDISGSSQLIPFRSGYVACVHEASIDPTTNKRTYWHRFAYFSKELMLLDLSKPFVFFERQIEFCAGLAWLDHDTMLISFGVRDEEAWVATLSADDVHQLIWERD